MNEDLEDLLEEIEQAETWDDVYAAITEMIEYQKLVGEKGGKIN